MIAGCIHVGLPKTATSLLQASLFPHHPQIEYLGKFYEGRSRFRDSAVRAIIMDIARGNVFKPVERSTAFRFAPKSVRERMLGRHRADESPGASSSGVARADRRADPAGQSPAGRAMEPAAGPLRLPALSGRRTMC